MKKTQRYTEFLLSKLPKAKDTITSLPSPHEGKQKQFVDSEADIALFGGAAGSGKTIGLLLDFARSDYLRNPGYSGIIFRRTNPEITYPGGLLDESQKLYYGIKGVLKLNPMDWTFPSGSKVGFRHLQYDKTIYNFQGSQITRIGFDELTHYTEKQFWYLLSRNRSVCGIKPRIRATCNPSADSWVAKLVSWYISPSGLPDPDRIGVLRWFIRKDDDLVWDDDKETLIQKHPGLQPKSFTFIAATIEDNPTLLKHNPEYIANLQALHPVERARLLEGNWKVRFSAGKVFSRDWFNYIDLSSVPDGGSTIRFWDLAATAKSVNKEACYTAGVLMRKVGQMYYILDVIAEQLSPSEGDKLIEQTANKDGRFVSIRWELEGGSAGRWVENYLLEHLQGFDAKAVKPLGDKLTRAKPFASDSFNRKVYLVKAPWNEQYLNWLSDFDGTSGKGKINDVIDASSGAYKELARIPDVSQIKTSGIKRQSIRPAKKYYW